MSDNFVSVVNRILRMEGIIRGSDDAVTDFNSSQHAANIEYAKLAVQDELSHISAWEFLDREEANSTITTVEGTRVYTLATDFVSFADMSPFLTREDGSGNAVVNDVLEYPGGERQLRRDTPTYREVQGGPLYWYFAHGPTKAIGLYHVPDASNAGTVYRYYYEKDISVSVETDTVPFVTSEQCNAFAAAAARRFKYYRLPENVKNVLFPRGLDKDGGLEDARSRLARLIVGKDVSHEYGRRY